nr:retrovirus-related Pol polyprotein from transposon TNT 1-94 [Tanacetum cinerariifolium]
MTAVEVWSKLETLYMTKSLANKLCLKKKLYTFYMPVGQKNSEHRDEFNKIFLDLANIEDMMVTLNSKEIKEMSKAKGDNGEGLYINGSMYVLSETQRDNYVYSLDGRTAAAAGELNASVEEKDILAQVSHKRLGHIREVGLHVLEKQGLFGKKSLGHPGDYRMLRVFGRVVYSYVKQGKLEPGALKYVLLGYHEGVKGYKLYRLNDESPKIITSRNGIQRHVEGFWCRY